MPGELRIGPLKHSASGKQNAFSEGDTLTYVLKIRTDGGSVARCTKGDRNKSPLHTTSQ